MTEVPVFALAGEGNPASARLRLYIAKATPNSARAERNLQAAISDLDGSSLGLEIVDVFTHPKRAIIDGVFATPTLIGFKAGARLTMIGDLTDTAKLMALLHALLDLA